MAKKTINYAGTNLRYTQIAPGSRFINPVRGRSVRGVNNMVGGFGTRDDTPFEQGIPGRIIGVSKIQSPHMIRNGIPGQKVAANPGSDFTQQYIKKLTVSLAATQTDVQYFIAGTVLWYLNSTNVTDLINIRIGAINADSIPWQPGNGLEGVPFNQVFITIPSAIAGATATLLYYTDTPEKPSRFF